MAADQARQVGMARLRSPETDTHIAVRSLIFPFLQWGHEGPHWHV